jgi:hypothetical protein
MHYPGRVLAIGVHSDEEKLGLIHGRMGYYAIHFNGWVGQRGFALARLAIEILVCLKDETVTDSLIAHVWSEILRMAGKSVS